MRLSSRSIVTISIALILVVSVMAVRLIPVYADPACAPAGGTGLTAKIVLSNTSDKGEDVANVQSHGDSDQATLSNTTVDATGCDVGVYVSPGSNGIVISGITVTGAKDHGIFIQDASHVTVKNSLVTGGGAGRHACPTPLSPPPCIAEDKALQLVGTTDSNISNNIVKGNSADGGIGIADDGPASVGGDPAALTPSATVAHPSVNDKIIGNVLLDNANGCGIVVASYDANVGVKNIEVRDNTVLGVPPGGGPFGGPGSFYGQIVVAGDGPFAMVSDVKVVNNHIDGSLLPGIVLHANVFGDKIAHTVISGNMIADNGWYPPFFGPPGDTNVPLSPNTTGISLVAEVGLFPASLGPEPVVSQTHVESNTVLGDHTGVWLCGTSHTSIEDLTGNSTVRIGECTAGGS